MQDAIENSPASVATDLKKVAATMDKIDRPPIDERSPAVKPPRPKTEKAKSFLLRASSLPQKSAEQFDLNDSLPNLTYDDINMKELKLSGKGGRGPAKGEGGPEGGRGEGGEGLFISEATRKILERMDERQVKNARKGFTRVKQLRRQSSTIIIEERSKLGGSGHSSSINGSRRLSRQPSSGDDLGSSCNSNMSFTSKLTRDELGDIERGSGWGVGKPKGGGGERRFSKSMGALGRQLESFDNYLSDGDRGESDDEEEGEFKVENATPKIFPSDARDKGVVNNERRLSRSMGAMAAEAAAVGAMEDIILEDVEDEDNNFSRRTSFNPLNRNLGQLNEVEEFADEALERILKSNSAEKAQNGGGDGDKNEHRPSMRRRGGIVPGASARPSVSAPRRGGIVTQSASAREVTPGWKPLSSGRSDSQPKCERKTTGGMGSFWNKITSGLTSEAPDAPQQPEDRLKNLTAAQYLRKAQKKASKCQFLQSVALYNLALVKQREELGENHIDCGNTLNEVGVCWMMLGERYPALTAFEEALYIRQKELGHGAMEVAETTNNIWMILHEERNDSGGVY